MEYADATFDFVFGISVFTHLPEELQLEWLAELHRVTQPGGYLVLTTHGEGHYAKLLSATQLETMSTVGFLYVDTGYGQTIELPSFYQTAFHSEAYIRSTWSHVFEVVDVLVPGPTGHQDLVLLRKRG